VATIESVAKTIRQHEQLATCVECGRRVDEDHRHVRDGTNRKWHLSCVQKVLGRIPDPVTKHTHETVGAIVTEMEREGLPK
jgi:hypothetical protein